MTDETLSGPPEAADSTPQAATETEQSEKVEAPTEESVETPERKKKPGGWQRKLMRAESEIADLKQRLANSIPQPTPEKEPILSDFATYEEFNKASIAYNVQKNIETALKTREQQEQKVKQETEARRIQSEWQRKVDNLPDEGYEDFDDVMSQYKDYPTKPALHQALMESDLGPEMAYYLGTHPDKLEEINSKSPYAIAKEMVKLENLLQKNLNPSGKVSKLPAPIDLPKGSAKTVVNLQNMDTTSFISERYPHLLRRKR